MKPPEGQTSGDHPEDLLLPYLEDRLSREDRAMVEEHVSKCSDCTRELHSLDEILRPLKAHKEAICPERWQLYDFAETGDDPTGKLAGHLEKCPLCQEDFGAYKSLCEKTAMPLRVHEAFEKHFRQADKTELEPGSKISLLSLLERFLELFRIPTMALGAVAAAILVVVLVYPRGDIQPFIGLSSATWGQTEDEMTPKSSVARQTKPKVGMVISFKDFKKTWPKEKIDSLYQAVQPTPQMYERFDFVPPARWKDAIGKLGFKSDDRKEMLEKLRQEFDVKVAIFVEIISEGDSYRIESRSLDTKDGTIIRSRTDEASSQEQIQSKIQDAASFLLASQEKS